MIGPIYAHKNIVKGSRVLVYTVELEGEPATVSTLNDYGNVVVKYDRMIPGDPLDEHSFDYQSQIVHPRQVELQ